MLGLMQVTGEGLGTWAGEDNDAFLDVSLL